MLILTGNFFLLRLFIWLEETFARERVVVTSQNDQSEKYVGVLEEQVIVIV